MLRDGLPDYHLDPDLLEDLLPSSVGRGERWEDLVSSDKGDLSWEVRS